MDEVDNVDLAGVEVEGRGATFKRVDKLMRWTGWAKNSKISNFLKPSHTFNTKRMVL